MGYDLKTRLSWVAKLYLMKQLARGNSELFNVATASVVMKKPTNWPATMYAREVP